MKLEQSSISINVRKGDSKNVFLVKSHSNDKEYTVNLTTKECSCPHFQLRLKWSNGMMTCKHYDDLMKYINEMMSKNKITFHNVEEHIRSRKNSVEWNELSLQFGDDTIDEMLKLGMLYKQRGGRLGVLE